MRQRTRRWCAIAMVGAAVVLGGCSGGGSSSSEDAKALDVSVAAVGDQLVAGGANIEKVSLECRQTKRGARYTGETQVEGGTLKITATVDKPKDGVATSTFAVVGPKGRVSPPGGRPGVFFAGQWQVDDDCGLVRIDGQLLEGGAESAPAGSLTVSSVPEQPTSEQPASEQPSE